MTILALGESLEEIDSLRLPEIASAVFVSNTKQAAEALSLAEMSYEGEVSLTEVGFCKIEAQPDCLAGTLYIPKLIRMQDAYHRILFFINERHIVIIDNDDYAKRMLLAIQRKKIRQCMTREQFLYHFLNQIINKDLEMLGQYERQLMDMEEQVMSGKLEGFQSNIMPIRKELLTLNGYYDQLMDMGKELEENENHFFAKKQVKYFGIVADRADRLMGKTNHLLQYAQQIRDAYQAQVDAEQNKNMQFLTVVSTIFFPMTLITSWYGMNFKNMPELEHGYPGVIALCMIVIVICIVIFKKKKIL